MEFTSAEIFGLSLLIGVGLAASWLVLVMLGAAYVCIAAWLDDYEGDPGDNPVTSPVLRLLGFKKTEKYDTYAYRNAKRSGSDGEIAVFLPMLYAFFAPVALLIAATAYPVTIGVVIAYMLARLARFARRHKKLFDKHIKDPKAHK